jgi:hypothetical protein
VAAVQHRGFRNQQAAWLEDEVFDTYICWREACHDVRRAYALWQRSERQDRGLAFVAYGAAMDREECAAQLYREAGDRLRAYAT